MEVGRRLTAATAAGDIERAVVREAISLVPANAAALVRVMGERLHVAHESTTDLLRPEGLAEGVIGRVAATGQPIAQVSATEPAIRYLPVSLIAVPLVGGGRIDAVLVMVRGTTSSFTPNERERLVALAPIAAAAMQSSRQAEEQTLTDGLTGVGNRRRLDKELPRVVADAAGRSTAVIMVDLDHFKSVNDTHGHPAGDALLKAIAEVLRDTVRPADAVYRYGGEEFCVVLPETDGPTAVTVAERIRATVGGRSFDVTGSDPIRATASLGVASSTGADPADLVAKADRALYAAKQGGRDRVVLEGDRPTP